MPAARALLASLTPVERRLFARLDSPKRLQDYLERIPCNFEHGGETCKSARQVLKTRTAHCIEGAFLAAAVLWYHGGRPFLLDLKANNFDVDHVVVPFRVRGLWGALSKTNHPMLRYRDPVYQTVRELAMSYFHEYIIEDGRKTLSSFSDLFDLRRQGTGWITDPEPQWEVQFALDTSRHHSILRGRSRLMLRRADTIERRALAMERWPERRAR